MRFCLRGLMLVGLIGVVSLNLVGCGTGSGPIPVKGKVLLDGKPLPDASISFVPQQEGRQATGTTDAEGQFVLSTIDPRDGAMPGKYKVTISQNLPVEETPTGLSADEAMLAAAKAAAKPKAKSSGPQLPEDYTRLDRTPLSQEIPAAGDVVFDIKSK
ncbi:MAG: carboxypeptidase regulatory-like domain-containing protein [Pirellulaceae bacterium]|nr:carboxypeptidase regulatory-like domain-containing protein [Pirellulaceae bacterium]